LASFLFERGPDEEGIETAADDKVWSSTFERGPDEEGIETPSGRLTWARAKCSNADLMKKGLRHDFEAVLLLLRSNADLMKKGLRHR